MENRAQRRKRRREERRRGLPSAPWEAAASAVGPECVNGFSERAALRPSLPPVPTHGGLYEATISAWDAPLAIIDGDDGGDGSAGNSSTEDVPLLVASSAGKRGATTVREPAAKLRCLHHHAPTPVPRVVVASVAPARRVFGRHGPPSYSLASSAWLDSSVLSEPAVARVAAAVEVATGAAFAALGVLCGAAASPQSASHLTTTTTTTTTTTRSTTTTTTKRTAATSTQQQRWRYQHHYQGHFTCLEATAAAASAAEAAEARQEEQQHRWQGGSVGGRSERGQLWMGAAWSECAACPCSDSPPLVPSPSCTAALLARWQSRCRKPPRPRLSGARASA